MERIFCVIIYLEIKKTQACEPYFGKIKNSRRNVKIGPYNYNPYPYGGYQQPLSNTQYQTTQPVYQAPLDTVNLQNYAVKQEIDYNKNSRLNQEKAVASVCEYEAKREIDKKITVIIAEKKADIQLKKDNRAEKFTLTEDGGIVKEVEYLTEKPKEYSIVNFRLNGRPIRYTCINTNNAVLCLSIILQNLDVQNLYLDLDVNESGYYWRKFRNAGIVLKKRQRERREIIFEFVEWINSPDLVEIVEVPAKRGFYVNGNGELCYAGKQNLIWKDVKKYAR